MYFVNPPLDTQNKPQSPETISTEIGVQQEKIKYLEKVIQINAGLNMIVEVLILFFLIFLLAVKFNIFDLSGSKQANQNVTLPAPSAPVFAEGNPVSPKSDTNALNMFINEQGVDLSSDFKAPKDNFHLTLNGPVKKEVFGFLPYWVLPQSADINIDLLTSVSFFGLDVDQDGNIIKQDVNHKVVDNWARFQSDANWTAFIQRARRNKTKVYVTIKCFNQGDIVSLVTSEKARQNFITNALFVMNSKSLDGINIDFEYIGTPDPKVRDGFSVLMTDLNKEMKKQYPASKLTIDTFADAAANKRLHDVTILAQNSDALVIMGYDFHTPGSSFAGAVAPLEGSSLAIATLMNSYLDKAPADKLILAVPYYGYDWPVVPGSASNQVIGTRSDVRILPYAGIIGSSKNTQFNWDENAASPFYSYTDSATNQKRVVYFDNTRSLGLKYDLINQKKMQGVGIWALGYDGTRKELLQLLADKFLY